MARYIQSFETSGAVQTALDNGVLGKPYVAYVEDSDSIDWDTNVPARNYSNEYLTFEILSAGTINIQSPGGKLLCNIQYRLNNGTWQTAQFKGTTGYTIGTFNVNDIIEFKGNTSSYGYVLNAVNNGNNFSNSTAAFNVYGNIMSLIYEDDFIGKTSLPSDTDRNFCSMFKNTSIVNASNLVLPATTLTNYCYSNMFYGSSLTTAPSILPATTLTEGCYQDMFRNCSSLTTAPELPATTLAAKSYSYMFNSCSSLNYIKCLATDRSATDSTYSWVTGVYTQNGTFVKAASMSSWPSGNNGIPANWTIQDAS